VVAISKSARKTGAILDIIHLAPPEAIRTPACSHKGILGARGTVIYSPVGILVKLYGKLGGARLLPNHPDAIGAWLGERSSYSISSLRTPVEEIPARIHQEVR
jgi:hypothetical protein